MNTKKGNAYGCSFTTTHTEANKNTNLKVKNRKGLCSQPSELAGSARTTSARKKRPCGDRSAGTQACPGVRNGSSALAVASRTLQFPWQPKHSGCCVPHLRTSAWQPSRQPCRKLALCVGFRWVKKLCLLGNQIPPKA